MDEMTKAREWLDGQPFIWYVTNPPVTQVAKEELSKMLAAYGAHCAAEARAEMGGTFTRVSNELDDMRLRAEAERDALALQVADLRAALDTAKHAMSDARHHLASSYEADFGSHPVHGMISSLEGNIALAERALAAPTSPAVARVAAAVALAEGKV